ncbi:Acetylglutamate kinase [Saliniradius amylolyticus]|uniref:Acetylglutamate kinase n=1 Tax=Saliniradius amylolyticus TaxID=2183582 RepID=A0A2S2E7L3_9ALTE|nr:acetylglutamate kinase [Saliniradius amylolyticus]AWL13210.1 Acetylglutamate kinase [Saliniradius amylolyticus]
MTPLVIKVGGALLDAYEQGQALFSAIKKLKAERPVVLVHGGGNLTNDWLARLGFESQKIDGLRVTPPDQLPFVVGALAGTANKLLVSMAHQQGINAVGLSLADGKMVNACLLNAQLGAVGQASAGDPKVLHALLGADVVPVVSSIGLTEQGELCNINADDGAVALAQTLGAELVLLSDVPGVLDGDGQLLVQLTATEISALIEQRVIHGGMSVKVKAALAAANSIGQRVYIAGWQQPQLLTTLADEASVGTCIVPDFVMENQP